MNSEDRSELKHNGISNEGFHDRFAGVANRYADFRPHYPAALFDYFSTLAAHA